MSDEQPLNTLRRFRKHPQRLVLEEHSHCEVPAGCGGVVLRWRNPLAAVPLTLSLYAPVKVTFFVDGAALQSSRVDVAPGRHVLGIAIENVDLDNGLLMVAAVYDPKQDRHLPPADVTETPVKI